MIALKNIKNYLVPLPVILVTSRLRKNNGEVTDNIMAAGWTGTLDAGPHLIYVGIGKESCTANIIKETREFGVCIPSAKILEQVDLCGTSHGDKVNKFKLANFSKFEAMETDIPLISECTINMECKLKDMKEHSSCNMFTGEIVKTHLNPNYTQDNGKPDYKKMDILCIAGSHYYTLGKQLEKTFFTAKK